jgi:hypothetical protein
VLFKKQALAQIAKGGGLEKSVFVVGLRAAGGLFSNEGSRQLVRYAKPHRD